MNDYYTTFLARMTADGYTYKQQIEKLAQKNFDRYLQETPTAVDIIYNGDFYKVAIVENKQDEYRLSKQMLSSINDDFPIGALVYWRDFEPKDCPENYWIVWKKQQNSIKDHNVNYISRCNHKLKWIDNYGVRHEQYVYEFSSKENMIRATFKSRVQEIIASEPNKFMEIIMPFTKDIKREQRFIVDGEAWYVIEFDSSSVDGITYITLGEDKKDLQNDLLIEQGQTEDLADYKKEDKFYIFINNVNPTIEKNTSYTIKPYYYKENVLVDDAIFNFYSYGRLIGTGTSYEQLYEKDVIITVKLKEKEEIQSEVNILVSDEPVEDIRYFILGDNSIRWSRTAIFSVVIEQYGNDDMARNVAYTINNDTLAKLEVEDDIAYITANDKRKSGKITLTATGQNFSIEKEIQIISLW